MSTYKKIDIVMKVHLRGEYFEESFFIVIDINKNSIAIKVWKNCPNITSQLDMEHYNRAMVECMLWLWHIEAQQITSPYIVCCTFLSLMSVMMWEELQWWHVDFFYTLNLRRLHTKNFKWGYFSTVAFNIKFYRFRSSRCS